MHSILLRLSLIGFAATLAIAACGGQDQHDSSESSTAAASCSPSPTPSCSPGFELVQESPSPSPSQSTQVATSGGGLTADGWVDDVCSFIKWVCRRKQANTPGGGCPSNTAPTTCPATGCWTDDGGGFCTQYSCAGVANGSPPTASGGWSNGTGCQTN